MHVVCGCADWVSVLRDSNLPRAVENAGELDGGFLQDEGTDGCVHGEVQKGARGEMNNARRREIEKLQVRIEELKEELKNIAEEVQAVLDDEEDALNNTPDSLQGTERYEISEAAVESLTDARDALDDAINSLSEIN